MPRKRRPAGPKTEASNPTSVVELVDVAQTLGARSGFLDERAIPAGDLAEFVRSRFPTAGEEAIADLIESTVDAVTQFRWDLAQPNKKVVAEKYSAIVESASRLADALSEIRQDSSFEGPFLDLLVPKVSSPDQIERGDRIRRLMISDLFWLRAVLEPQIQLIRDTQLTRRDFQYRCAFRIAMSWLEATGELPTLTRNTEAVAGPQSTAFQTFLAQAVHPPIGEAIVRRVIEELGDIVAQSKLPEIPKGPEEG